MRLPVLPPEPGTLSGFWLPLSLSLSPSLCFFLLPSLVYASLLLLCHFLNEARLGSSVVWAPVSLIFASPNGDKQRHHGSPRGLSIREPPGDPGPGLLPHMAQGHFLRPWARRGRDERHRGNYWRASVPFCLIKYIVAWSECFCRDAPWGQGS